MEHIGPVNLGKVVQWNQSFSSRISPNRGTWLRPQLSWNSTYYQNNGPEPRPTSRSAPSTTARPSTSAGRCRSTSWCRPTAARAATTLHRGPAGVEARAVPPWGDLDRRRRHPQQRLHAAHRHAEHSLPDRDHERSRPRRWQSGWQRHVPIWQHHQRGPGLAGRRPHPAGSCRAPPASRPTVTSRSTGGSTTTSSTARGGWDSEPRHGLRAPAGGDRTQAPVQQPQAAHGVQSQLHHRVREQRDAHQPDDQRRVAAAARLHRRSQERHPGRAAGAASRHRDAVSYRRSSSTTTDDEHGRGSHVCRARTPRGRR